MPTPADAAGVDEGRIASHLKAHRIRRFDAAEVLGILRQKPIAVSPGTTKAATAHIAAVAARLKLVNQQIKETHRHLDVLCNAFAESDGEETAPGQILEQRDVTNALTVLENGVRVTYHATVLAGVHVGEQGMVGANAVATKDVRPYHVYVGIPAKSVRVKPNAPEPAMILRTSEHRVPR